MKYMTFPASCSFCCIANMLEQYRVDVTDCDIVVGAGLPYLFQYDVEDDSFTTGAMLQHIPCMVGLMGEYGKHAMVFTAYEQEKYRFLNPHREDDEQEDWMILTEEELLERLSEVNYIGHLMEDDTSESFINAEDTLTVIKQYCERFVAFCSLEQTMANIRTCRDRILRPVALDLPVMMPLIGETSLAGKLTVLQGQIFEMIRLEHCVPADIVDMDLFGEIMDEYQEVVRAHWSKPILKL